MRSESCRALTKGVGSGVHERLYRAWTRLILVSKNWIKQLNTLPVLHFKLCLINKYGEKTAHSNGNFDTDNQIYVT
jgi:hypothetical protein